MQIVMELAGYTLGRSDLVRRAMSKKKADVMEKERKNFVYGNEAEGVEGCIKRGISEDIANKVFDEMTDFAKYAFNKSHAAAYAVVAYQTAYLKYHYPVEYMAALISSVKENSGKVSSYIQTCRTMGIKILPPDINEGEGDFSVSGNSIRYGLSAVKSVGEGVTDVIRQKIVEDGPFKDLEDFIMRLSNKEANKRTIESFICAGAFDSFGYNRKQMMMVYPSLIDHAGQNKKSAITGQMNMLSFLSEEEQDSFRIKYPQVEEYAKEDLLAKEKEMLGIYVSGHPLDDYMDIINSQVTAKSTDFLPDEDSGEFIVKDKIPYTVGGMIEAITVKTTKQGDNMAFVTLEDLYGTVEIVIFPRDYNRYKHLIVKDNKILVRGNASVTEDEGKLLLSSMYTFEDIKKDLDAEKKEVWVCFEDENAYNLNEKDFLHLLKEYKGRTPVFVQLRNSRTFKPMGERYRVLADDLLLENLKSRWGEKNVLIREKK